MFAATVFKPSPILRSKNLIKRNIHLDADTLMQIPIVTAAVTGFLSTGFHIIKQNEVGLVETFGKYQRTVSPGLRYVWPIGISQIKKIPVNITKIEIPNQIVGMKEQTNVNVNLVAYYQVNNPYKANYNIDNYKNVLPTLTPITLRNILGTFTLSEANSQRDLINEKIKKELKHRVQDFGIDIISIELLDINQSKI